MVLYKCIIDSGLLNGACYKADWFPFYNMRQQCSPLKIASNSAVLQLAEYDDYWDERQEQEGAVSQNTPNSDTNEPAGIQTDESLQYTE